MSGRSCVTDSEENIRVGNEDVSVKKVQIAKMKRKIE